MSNPVLRKQYSKHRCDSARLAKMLPRQSYVSPEQSQTGCSRLVGVGVGVSAATGVSVGNGVGVVVGVGDGVKVGVGKTSGSERGALSTASPGIQNPFASKYQVPSVYHPIIVNCSPTAT